MVLNLESMSAFENLRPAKSRRNMLQSLCSVGGIDGTCLNLLHTAKLPAIRLYFAKYLNTDEIIALLNSLRGLLYYTTIVSIDR